MHRLRRVGRLAQANWSRDSDGQVTSSIQALPLAAVNDKALLAAQAAEAAARAGQILGDARLSLQLPGGMVGVDPRGLSSLAVGKRRPKSGLDAQQFSADLNREDIVAKSRLIGNLAGIQGCLGRPSYFINGQIYTGPKDYDNLSRIT